MIQKVEKGGEVIRIQFCGWGQVASTGLLQGGFEGIRTQFWGQEAQWVGGSSLGGAPAQAPTHACHYVKNPQKRRGSKLSKLSHQSEIQEGQLGKNLLNQITAR